MRPRKRSAPPPSGPSFSGEQVAAMWLWIWDSTRRSTGAALDEARRLAVAFFRAMNDAGGEHVAFTTDRTPVQTACFAHYLLTRTERWTRDVDGLRGVEVKGRVEVLRGARETFETLLGLAPEQLRESFDALRIALPTQGGFGRSAYRPEVREDVVIESLDEGPALPMEHRQREEEARRRMSARWEAERNKPKRLRTYKSEP